VVSTPVLGALPHEYGIEPVVLGIDRLPSHHPLIGRLIERDFPTILRHMIMRRLLVGDDVARIVALSRLHSGLRLLRQLYWLFEYLYQVGRLRLQWVIPPGPRVYDGVP
jgi:hypothetical protein